MDPLFRMAGDRVVYIFLLQPEADAGYGVGVVPLLTRGASCQFDKPQECSPARQQGDGPVLH
jgi:hypothetical protein